MKRLGNTLYITSQGSYLAKDGDCVLISRDGAPKTRIPLHNVDGIVGFGQVSASPFLLGHCAENGVTLTWLTEHGRFLARVEGPVAGNVRLRRAQYRASDDPETCAGICRAILAAKIAGQRDVLLRVRRDHGDTDGHLSPAIDALATALRQIARLADVDALRGCEGDAARAYFGAFPALIRSADPAFVFSGRNRRPPRDAVNCVLSFVYTLLVHDARSALESVGLDPQVGFLHRERPGRPSLALDLMEEFRAGFADRLTLSLINRGQLRGTDFLSSDSGAVTLSDDARKAVLVAYQNRKSKETRHPFLGETCAVGLLWHVQARLLAMHLRGDLDAYPPCLPR